MQNKHNDSSQRDKNLRYLSDLENARKYQQRQKKRRKQESFGSQNVDVTSYILAPKGYEKLMFTIYFILVPYLAGLLFLFLFIAKGNMGGFLVLDLTRFFIVWAIGYEVVASSILLAIFVSAIKFYTKKEQ